MDLSFNNELCENLIRSGEFKSDITLDANDGCWRIRVVSYEGRLYQHVMINGEVNEVFELKVCGNYE